MNDEVKEVEEMEEEMEAAEPAVEEAPAEPAVEEAPAEPAVEEAPAEKKPVELKEAVLPEPEAPKVKVGDKEGIKETKEVLALGFAFAKSFKLAKADGNINLLDAPHLMAALPHLGPALDNVGKVPHEIKDLSEEEVGELLKFAALHLSESMDDESLVVKVEKSLKVGLAVLDLLKEF